MELTDLAPLEKWISFEEEVVKRSGMDVNAFNREGIRISEFKHWANKLCPAIKATDKGQAFICAVAHMNIAAMAAQEEDVVIEECDAGLLKMVIPIFIKDEFVGSFACCGFLLDDGEVDSFMVNKTTEIDEEEIDTLSQGIQSITMEKAQELAAFIKKEIDKLVGKY
ncbi:MAG: PocR ligand-binding domain-containing protein [Deltaproteobacteria bacterium]|nr:PocR ligand-binding domain-containing protein [Deltaproteobacteria bacterium]MBW2182137.1 PocR ligand-binding domain-containing protein [Deltaproteobacteria bacterium]